MSGLLLPGQRPRWPQLGLQLQARLAMAVGMLVLLITAAVIAASLVAEAGDVGQLGRTRGLQVDNLQLEVAMVDQETGVRGYAATGQPVFLQPYESGRAQLGPLLRALEQESRGTRFAAAVLDVQVTAGDWSTWAAVRKAQVDAARAPVVNTAADQVGKRQFDEFRAADGRLATLLQDHLQPLLTLAARSRQRVVDALLVGGPLVFGSLLALDVLLVLSTLRPIRKLADAAEQLATDERTVVPGAHRSDEVGSLARALQEWQVAESLRETMIEHAPIGIAHLALDGSVLGLNSELTAMFGHPREDLRAMRFGDTTEPEHLEASRQLFEDVTSGRVDRRTVQKLYRRSDGATFWGELTLAGVRDAEGAVRSCVAMVTDITDRKEKLNRAAAVQRGLLPKVVPMLRGYELTGHCMLAEEVGGDFFDWYLSSHGELTLTLGDVMGKGMPAAILMATIRAALRATAGVTTPAEAVRVAASSIAADLEESLSFVTLLHARLDETSGELRFIDAGHGFVFLLRRSGELLRFPRQNLPLGVLEEESYREVEVRLQPGDTFVAFSDGVLDLYPGLENDFQRLAPVLSGASRATDMVARLCARGQGAQLHDDVTVIALQRSEDPAASSLLLTGQSAPAGPRLASPFQ